MHIAIHMQNLSSICHVILQSVTYACYCSSPLVWLVLCSFLHSYNKMVAACLKAIMHTHYILAYMHGYKLLMLG